MSPSPEDLRKIGGSDVAAILNRDPYKSAIDVWNRVVHGKGQDVSPEQAKRMRRGTLMEPVIREMAREEFGLKLTGPVRWEHWPAASDFQRDVLRASLDDQHWLPDAYDTSDFDVVEFKSVEADWAHKWGAEGTDQIPENYLLQAQFYLWVTGSTKARVIPLIGVDDLRQYFVLASVDLHNLIAEAVDHFWRKNVLERIPPEPDGSDSYSEYLDQRFPKRTGTLIEADAELTRLATEHRDARDEADRWDERKRLLAQQIAVRLGEADGCEGYLPDGQRFRVTNRIGKGRPSVDWEALCLAHNLPADVKERFSKRTPSATFTNKILKGA